MLKCSVLFTLAVLFLGITRADIRAEQIQNDNYMVNVTAENLKPNYPDGMTQHEIDKLALSNTSGNVLTARDHSVSSGVDPNIAVQSSPMTPLPKNKENNVYMPVEEGRMSSLDAISLKLLVGERDAISIAGTQSIERLPCLVNTTQLNVFSVDFHWEKNLIFFAAKHAIHCATFTGGGIIFDQKVVVSRGVEGPVSLAVDWVHDRLYWMTDYYQTVESANLDGTDRTLLVDSVRPFSFPNNIVIDPYQKVFFFVSDYAVFKSNLDGTSVANVVIEGNERGEKGRGVKAIALDRANSTLYLTGRSHEHPVSHNTTVYLAHTDYNGDNKKDVYNGNAWDNWNDIYSMDVFDHILYFVHFQNNRNIPDALWSLDLLESQCKPKKLFVPKHSRSDIWSIRAFHPCVQRLSGDPSCSRSP